MEEDIFEVHWTEPAQEDFDEIVDEIAEDAPVRANKFGNRLLDAAASLRWSPYRCPRAPDEPSCRHLIIKKYRIIFEIDEVNRMVWIRAVMFPYQQYRPHD
jgi:plasmid stabilization system protein ParE